MKYILMLIPITLLLIGCSSQPKLHKETIMGKIEFKTVLENKYKYIITTEQGFKTSILSTDNYNVGDVTEVKFIKTEG